MQTEELEDTRNSSKETSPVLADMTVNATTDPPSPKPEPQCSSQFSSDTDYSLDRMKLESYIERIIPESPASSDITEEEALDTKIITDPFKNLQEQNPNESIRSWLQRITQMQNQIQKKMSADNVKTENKQVSINSSNVSKSSRILKYEDLPYMGEMTLDNSKPRRGRKPKKADICHLIYKNYGTILSGTPDSSKEAIDNECALKKKQNSLTNNHKEVPTLNKNKVQHKIISSLLEKRLTQETRRNDSIAESLTTKLLRSRDKIVNEHDQDEPLNLCIRDLNQLKIRFLRKNNKGYTLNGPEIKSEPQSDDEVEFINETSSLSSQDTINNLNDFTPPPIPADSKTCDSTTAPAGYIYWPSAGVFIHPMALQQQLMYYQRMAAGNNYTLPNHSPRPPPETTPKSSTELRKLAPKIRPKKSSSDEITLEASEAKTKRNASTPSDKTPTKRKRSAIFIPPIPTENQTNPATEVSICKFKFTGGAKPSLQEKKMLSVDSGGNFRYYSGTGDKSMRGYEFFPRETLQQQVESAHGSSTGAFLQASGEKIFPPPIDFTGKQSHPELLLPPDVNVPNINTMQDLNARHKKRKSRKSLQREKLEQTFKEKGFLIQTQQLESAEGATYCKFRQLRKFTRYLFRSWKDYLPGNVRELQEGEEEQDIEELARLSASDLGSSDLSGPL
ncbi:hypothetical protein FQR65_LT02389 [Abscondita terminalis]|nr:hypothetical protein FQR65_LT02389 [Abscondita terminalis]